VEGRSQEVLISNAMPLLLNKFVKDSVKLNASLQDLSLV